MLRSLKCCLLLLSMLGSIVFSAQSQPKKKGSAPLPEVLYNGIILPETWPPKHVEQNSLDPIPTPYLEKKPNVIDISLGRQLFVDDFLVEKTNLTTTFHKANKYAGNPVIIPTTSQEKGKGPGGNKDVVYLGHGGFFYDPSDGVFKIFYTAGWRGGLALATSKNLIHWQKPAVNETDSSNILLAAGAKNAGEDNSIWLDLETKDENMRLKYLTDRRTNDTIMGRHSLLVSNGRQWSQSLQVNANYGDYSSFFYNPFRKKWVFSIKRSDQGPRSRMYLETDEFLDGWDWKNKSVFWVRTDSLDMPDPEIKDRPQLYSLNAVAYESIILGQFYIHLGPTNEISNKKKEPKITEIQLGYSRDGFHWHRPDRQAFIGASRVDGSWDKGYIHGTTGMCAVIGDSLYFPYTGYSGIATDGTKGMYTGASIGLATLRRDGFVSLNTAGAPGFVLTRPLKFKGKYLFVNVDCSEGSLRVEILDKNNKVIPGYELQNCMKVVANKTLQRIEWRDKKDVAELDGREIRIRFYLENGALYSFWITPDAYGASFGYQAAGSPGLEGVIDDKGALNY